MIKLNSISSEIYKKKYPYDKSNYGRGLFIPELLDVVYPPLNP